MMMKKRCELCDQRAAMHCESDQACLCWSCDEKVHGANFLVAKHARALLCHLCQSPTPWKASGPKLGPTVSVCECCRRICEEKVQTGCRGGARRDVAGDGCSRSGGGEEAEDYDDDLNEMLDDDEYDDEGEDEEEEVDDEEEEEEEEGEDGENQVVPLSRDSPPPAASSSTEEESTSRSMAVASGGLLAETIASGGLRMKRPRQSEDLDSDDEIGCVSLGLDNEEATSSSALLRPTKQRRAVEATPIATGGGRRVGAESLMNALKRLSAATVGNAAATVSSICRLSGYHQSR